MKAAYFTFDTTGSNFERDRIIDFSGIKYDHKTCSVIDRFRYQEVADMTMVNDRPHPHHKAMDMLNEWMCDHCYYFTVNADKKKHFLRSEFFYNYLNPYDHERSSSIDKIVDFMELMRVMQFLGNIPFEIPVSPLGELSYEIDHILRLNAPGQSICDFMAFSNQKIIQGGGDPFQLIKTRQEKERLLSGRAPIVSLTHVDKELDVSTEIVIPIVRSEENKNRFYVWRPSGGSASPSELLQSLIDEMAAGGTRSVTKEMRSPAVFFIDINKSGVIASLNEIPTPQKVALRNTVVSSSHLDINYQEVVRALDKLDTIKDIRKGHYKESRSVYDAKLGKKHMQVGKKIREAAIHSGVNEALDVMSKNHMINDLIEKKRFAIFCYRNSIDTKNIELGLDPSPY